MQEPSAIPPPRSNRMKRSPTPSPRARTARTAPTGLALGYALLAAGGVVLIMLLTLYPFEFEQFSRFPHVYRYFAGLKFGGYSRCCTHLTILEPLGNVLLFVPLGCGLAGLLHRRTAPWTATFLLVLGLCAGFSLTVEVLQVFQPRRNPSLADLLTNSTGGALGFLCYRLLGGAVARRVWAFRARRAR